MFVSIPGTSSFGAMNTSLVIAEHFRNVHLGGNWTCLNLRHVPKDSTWQ
jgi:hypothetical protein